MEEIESLQREFDWVLSTEVRTVVEQLRAAVQVPTDKVVFCSSVIHHDNMIWFDYQLCLI